MASRVDGSKVRLFATRKAAENGARAIGWPVGCVTPVETRFCVGWALCTGIDYDPNTGFPWVSREWFGEMYHARNSKAPPVN